jgi:hypothetical protein
MTNEILPSRRQFLQRASAAAVLTAVHPVTATTIGASGAVSILALSAAEAVNSITRGEIPAERYAAVLLGRCEAGKSLNAFISLEPERVLEAARECDIRRRAGAKPSPLHGDFPYLFLCYVEFPAETGCSRLAPPPLSHGRMARALPKVGLTA